MGEVEVYNGTRDDLACLFSKMNFKIGAEIGVRTGDYSEILLKANGELHLYCIDPWCAYEEMGSLRKQRTYQEIATAKLAPYDVMIVVKTSEDALRDFQDNYLDFVYIDGSHIFDNVMLDIIGWTKKVKPGGIVSGHDYFRHRSFGVMDAVDAYVKAHDLQLYVTKEAVPSWYFVKKGVA